jgi:single-stranded DNA-binding protein
MNATNLIILIGEVNDDVRTFDYGPNKSKTGAGFQLAVAKKFPEGKFDYFDCSGFDKDVVVKMQEAYKGATVMLWGSMESREQESKSGHTFYKWSVVVTAMKILSGSADNYDGAGSQGNYQDQMQEIDEDAPF